MFVYLLWVENNQSWNSSTKKLKGVFASPAHALQQVDGWAKAIPLNEFDEKDNVVWRFGADACDFVCQRVEVKG